MRNIIQFLFHEKYKVLCFYSRNIADISIQVYSSVYL